MFKNQIFTFILLFGMFATAQTTTDSSITSSKLTDENQILQSIYLLGDAGALNDDEKQQAHLKNLNDFFKSNSKSKDYLLFLGDNIYPNGLPKKEAEDHADAEKILNLQIEIAQNFNGKSIFIPGNHDYYSGGSKAVDRQMKYLQKALNKKSFAPSEGCPVERLEVNDDLVILFVDSQWYISNWDYDPKINRNCETIKTRDDFFDEIDDAINDYQNQNLVIAMHHPVASYGPHGGRFSLKKHLFPLQSGVPLPVIGTAVNLARSAGGVSPQDLQSKKYRELSKRLITLASGKEKVIIASGHDHNQQYISDGNFHQVISGSGSKSSPAFEIGFSKFADPSKGFAKIDLLPNRESILSFYSTEGATTKLLFTTSIYPQDQPHNKTYEKVSDTPVKASIYTQEEIEKSNFYTSLWGAHYRHLYGISIEVPQLDLNTYRGGFKILKEGGGNQSNSLRVEDKAGIKYSLRAMKKDATRLLQRVVFQDVYLDNKFDDTASEELILDFFTASHPYAFLAIEDIAEKLGVYHTSSKLFYLPKQDALGKYNDSYGDGLFMLEERPDEDYSNPNGSYGQPDDIEDTQDLFARLQRDEKYIVDENSYIRARILDMLIGDFDRHIDQWDWAEFKTDSGDRIFKPIPKDRDQAFAKFDGGVLNLLRTFIPFVRMYPVYGDEIKHTDWFNNNVINLDRTILSHTSLEDWLREVSFVQQQLDDQSIEDAFAKMPQEIQNDNSTAELKSLLIARRNNLKKIIENYYGYFTELVVVTGTNKDDFFDIERKENGMTHIQVFRNKGGERAEKITDRIVDAKATKEVWVYGLDDTDSFSINGNPKGKHVKIRLIGGFEKDTYTIENKRKVVIHDYKEEDVNIESEKPKLRKSDQYNLNFFDYSKNNLNTIMVLPSIGANPDTGFNAGVNITTTKHGFYDNPFERRQSFGAKYFAETDGVELTYQGEFTGIFDRWNFLVDARFTSDRYAMNFFGLGNNLSNPEDDLGRDFNRVEIGFLNLQTGFIRRGFQGSEIKLMAEVEAVEVEENLGRFVSQFFDPNFNPGFYDRKLFLGGNASYTFENYDLKANPKLGMHFNLETGGKYNTDDEGGFVYLKSKLGFYNPLSKNQRWVLRTQLYTHLVSGGQIQFYQAATLGQDTGLRGYRFQRFLGNRAFSSSADIRYSFKNTRTGLLPIQMGVFAGADVGRVWLNGENSQRWHPDAGGGFWINMVDTVSGTFNYFAGKDGGRFSFIIGVGF